MLMSSSCLFFLIDVLAHFPLVLHTASGFSQKSRVCHPILLMESFAKQFIYSGCLIAHYED